MSVEGGRGRLACYCDVGETRQKVTGRPVPLHPEMVATARQVWTTRSMEHFVMMERELQDVEGEECSVRGRFSVHLHLTAARAGGGPWRPVRARSNVQ